MFLAEERWVMHDRHKQLQVSVFSENAYLIDRCNRGQRNKCARFMRWLAFEGLAHVWSTPVG